jgi:hypothetical protein
MLTTVLSRATPRAAAGLVAAVGMFVIAQSAPAKVSLQTTASKATGADASALSFEAGVRSSYRDWQCPAGTAANALCLQLTGKAIVPGLALVSFSYDEVIDRSDPAQKCAVWTISNGAWSTLKGTVAFAGASQGCPSLGEGAGATVQFQFSGGVGAFSGASGNGTAVSSNADLANSTINVQWTGTLDVPGYDFDTTPPTLSSIATKKITIRRGLGAHVRYSATATDAIDGNVPVTCLPPSGSFFSIGKTTVTCSASDMSGNSARATFPVVVKRRR